MLFRTYVTLIIERKIRDNMDSWDIANKKRRYGLVVTQLHCIPLVKSEINGNEIYFVVGLKDI